MHDVKWPSAQPARPVGEHDLTGDVHRPLTGVDDLDIHQCVAQPVPVRRQGPDAELRAWQPARADVEVETYPDAVDLGQGWSWLATGRD
jgi:hypothetical protein